MKNIIGGDYEIDTKECGPDKPCSDHRDICSATYKCVTR